MMVHTSGGGYAGESALTVDARITSNAFLRTSNRRLPPDDLIGSSSRLTTRVAAERE